MGESDSVISFFIKLFEDFSLKRLLITGLALSALIVVVLIYERYTSNFELNKIEKSGEILTALHKIKIGPSHADDDIKDIKAKLLRDLKEIVDQKILTTSIVDSLHNIISTDKVKLFLSGAALWFFFLLLALPKSSKQKFPYIARLAVLTSFSLASGWFATILNLKLSLINISLVSSLIPLAILFIVGIAAGIAIPQFAAYRMRGFNAAAITVIRNTRTLLESYFADNGKYPRTLDETGVHAISYHVYLEYRLINQNKYTLSATHEKGDKVYFASSDINDINSKNKITSPAAVEKKPQDITSATE